MSDEIHEVEAASPPKPRELTVSKYHAEWKPFSPNVEFWNEVLVGRKITGVVRDDEGITAICLDSGELVNLATRMDAKGKVRGTICIQDGEIPKPRT